MSREHAAWAAILPCLTGLLVAAVLLGPAIAAAAPAMLLTDAGADAQQARDQVQLQTGVSVPAERTFTLDDVFAITGYSLLVAGSAEASTCKGPALDAEGFAERLGAAMALVDELELALASTELAALRRDLPCSVSVIPPEALYGIFFSAGLVAAYEERREEAVDLFARAVAIKGDVPLDTNYPPVVQQLYLVGKDRTSSAPEAELSLLPPVDATKVWLDGQPLAEPGPSSVWIKPGTHVVHVETAQGTQRAALLNLGDGAGLWADPRAAGVAVARGVIDGPAGSAANALLSAAAEAWGAETIYVAGSAGVFLYGDAPFARAAVPLAPTGDRLGVRLGVGASLRAAPYRPAPFAYATPTFELDVALIRGLEVGATVQIGVASFAEGTTSVLPVVTAGVQWGFSGARFRPFVGAHAAIAVDGPGSVKAGGVARFGLRVAPARGFPLRVAASGTFGWVGALQAGAAVTVGFGFGGPG